MIASRSGHLRPKNSRTSSSMATLVSSHSLAKRTFWEKATILHAEYHRPLEKLLPERYSRHYYDVAMMAQGPIRSEALADLNLLADVVRHKETFYPAAWAQYPLARPGTLRLVPRAERMAASSEITEIWKS